MRHAMRALTGIGCIAFLLAACAPTPTPVPLLSTATSPTPQAVSVTPDPAPASPMAPASTPLPEAIRITVWHDWPGVYETVYEDLVAVFNENHTDIRIELMKIEQLAAALDSELPPGEGPDILRWSAEQIGMNATLETIVPLDDYFNQDYLEAAFEPAPAAAMIWNDRIWGIPETQDGIAFIYNKALLDEEALPAPDDFVDLLDRARKFRDANPGKYYLCNQGLGRSDAYHVAPIYFSHDLRNYGGYVDDVGNVYLDTPEAQAAAEWIRAFSEVSPAETSPEVCQAMFINGQVAIWWTSSRAIRALKDAGIDYGIAPMGSPYVDVTLFMATPLALERGHMDAVLEVMEYLGSARVQKHLSLVAGTIPANSAALYAQEIQMLEIVAPFGAALYAGVPAPNHPFATCQWGPVGNATTAIWWGAKSPDAALADAQSAIEECIAARKK
ncbi:MAG: extracellular solute-binding protein [Anaerolineae bacterium]|nr:extracellular solute-binding protein [Anaerolineae bacterium]